MASGWGHRGTGVRSFASIHRHGDRMFDARTGVLVLVLDLACSDDLSNHGWVNAGLFVWIRRFLCNPPTDPAVS